ncbi:hypothetical protein SAMN05421759_102505 [Roseivivax lentus]|uniref:Uncharacterized protein n=1 Tax=Roseivivax lentus TaxID=633194 RepID=A0A1N7L9V0_9RHOB|nr:hypothetical protein [Roseivivax lentus]SIS70608.1 hypothetical protein SAMN05421759_102505 [Roseivivax lentus]
MPPEFYVIAFVLVVVMGLSAFYLGDDRRNVRDLSRVDLVVGGAGLFVATMYYVSILIAVLIVCLPIALFLAWWGELF